MSQAWQDKEQFPGKQRESGFPQPRRGKGQGMTHPLRAVQLPSLPDEWCLFVTTERKTQPCASTTSARRGCRCLALASMRLSTVCWTPHPLPGGSAAALAAVQEGSEVHEPPASQFRTAVSEPKVKILWLCRDVNRDWQAEAGGLCQGTSPACP